MNDRHGYSPERGSKMNSRTRWALVGFIAIAAYFLILEHRAHLSGLLYYWPFLLLLACPLLHVFMHRGNGHGGHGGHGGHHDETGSAADKSTGESRK
jgi:hypothetical protein